MWKRWSSSASSRATDGHIRSGSIGRLTQPAPGDPGRPDAKRVARCPGRYNPFTRVEAEDVRSLLPAGPAFADPGKGARAARLSLRTGSVASFIDYLYFSLSNSMAFTPADTMPLSARVKALRG